MEGGAGGRRVERGRSGAGGGGQTRAGQNRPPDGVNRLELERVQSVGGKVVHGVLENIGGVRPVVDQSCGGAVNGGD